MVKWIKKKLGITRLEEENSSIKKELALHEKFVTSKMAELKEFTRVDADIGVRGNNTIILSGVYKKQAYIKFYDVSHGEFIRLIEQMKDMKKYALVRNIDAPPMIRGTFEI